MTEQEAIGYLKTLPNRIPLKFFTDDGAKVYDEFSKVITSALEKQTPKVVTDTGNEERYEICCPNCNKDLYEKYDRNEKSLYCDECGQALDWGEEE